MEYKTEWMIDVTSMFRIVSELSDQYRITAVVDVINEDLAEIADMFYEGSSHEPNIEKFKELIEAGKIKIIYHSLQTNIPLSNAVDCIRLEPLYFVKDLKKKFE